jgi:pyruvate/2-oxoglutarate dehydrogenase complex dihydrolipoamide dehydrogenase (E3) component
MTKYIFFAGGMEEGNRAMKLRSTAVMSTSALTWRSSCPVLSVRIARSCFRTGIYTIPEISMAGKTEAQLTDAKILTRLESPSTRSWQKVRSWGWHWTTENTFRCRNADKCRGVYVIGENAAEIVHIGQAVLSLGSTIEYFATRCLTTRLWRKPTSWRPWTG